MDVTLLIDAAQLADELSRFRHKKIRLVLTPGGVKVDGKLIRPDGVEIQRFTADKDWGAIERDAGVLLAQIRLIDRKLVAEWCNAEPVDDH